MAKKSYSVIRNWARKNSSTKTSGCKKCDFRNVFLMYHGLNGIYKGGYLNDAVNIHSLEPLSCSSPHLYLKPSRTLHWHGHFELHGFRPDILHLTFFPLCLCKLKMTSYSISLSISVSLPPSLSLSPSEFSSVQLSKYDHKSSGFVFPAGYVWEKISLLEP